MTLPISRNKLKKWIQTAIDDFRGQDLVELPAAWVRVYDSLPDYMIDSEPDLQQLFWTIEGTEDSLPDIVCQLQRLKNALVEQLIAESSRAEITTILTWFDRTILLLIEKASGRLSKERALSKPYETFFWNSRDGMYISSIKGKFLHCNKALMEMLEAGSINEVLNMDIVSELYVNQKERQTMLDHLSEDSFFDHHEFCFRSFKGTVKTALESCYMVGAPNGEKYIVGIMIDVTEERLSQDLAKKHIEKIEKDGMTSQLAFRRMDKRFRTLLKLNQHPVILVEPRDFRILDCNPRFLKRYRYLKKDMTELCLRDLFHDEDWMRFFQQLSKPSSNGCLNIQGVCTVPKDGRSFTADIAVYEYSDDLGTLLFIQIEDQSQLLQLKNLLEVARKNINQTLEKAPFGIIGFRSDCQVALINGYLRELTGYGPRQLRNVSFVNRLFSRDEHRLKFNKYLRQFLNGKHVQDIPVDLKSKSGEDIHFLLNTTTFQFEGDPKPGFLALLKDVTRQFKLEEELNLAPERLGQSEKGPSSLEAGFSKIQNSLNRLKNKNRQRQRFIELLPKKFRVPFHVVLGYASLIRGNLSPADEHQEDLKIIEEHICFILSMLDKAIEFFGLEGSEVPFLPETHSVRFMLDQLFLNLAPVNLPPEVVFCGSHQILSVDLAIQTDLHLLECLLRHLVENAVLFTKVGDIRLTAYEENQNLWIELTDTGMGINGSDIPQVFEPFFQTGNHRDDQEHLGLGLTIARRCAELMGSCLELQSKPGVGTEVRFCLGKFEND